MSELSRDDVIIRAARLRTRLELGAYKALLRQLYGDEVYESEKAESDKIDWEMRYQEPAPPEVRRKLKAWWGWRKRGL